jgi:hypothetical protein
VRRDHGRCRRRQGHGQSETPCPQGLGAPFGAGTHNALPLDRRNLLVVIDETVLDKQEDGFKPIWIFDNQVVNRRREVTPPQSIISISYQADRR